MEKEVKNMSWAYSKKTGNKPDGKEGQIYGGLEVLYKTIAPTDAASNKVKWYRVRCVHCNLEMRRTESAIIKNTYGCLSCASNLKGTK